MKSEEQRVKDEEAKKRLLVHLERDGGGVIKATGVRRLALELVDEGKLVEVRIGDFTFPDHAPARLMKLMLLLREQFEEQRTALERCEEELFELTTRAAELYELDLRLASGGKFLVGSDWTECEGARIIYTVTREGVTFQFDRNPGCLEKDSPTVKALIGKVMNVAGAVQDGESRSYEWV